MAKQQQEHSGKMRSRNIARKNEHLFLSFFLSLLPLNRSIRWNASRILLIYIYRAGIKKAKIIGGEW